MITINNKEIRNLQEQVLKNAQDYENLIASGAVLDEFGIKVVGQVADESYLPPEDSEDFAALEYGDAYAIGGGAPWTLYVKTRTNMAHPEGDYWLNLGEFPKEGPVGPQGSQGPQGIAGNPGKAMTIGSGAPNPTTPTDAGYLDATFGNIYRYDTIQGWMVWGNIMGPEGPIGPEGHTGQQGPKGDKGDKGDTGDVGGFINIQGHVASSADLPRNPMPTDHTWAYLVGDDYKLWVQIPTTPGGSVYNWQDFGTLNVATYCTVNGEFQNVYNLDNKLDKVTSGNILYGTSNGQQTTYLIAVSALQNHVVKRDEYGRSKIETPTTDKEIANKEYVDDTAQSHEDAAVIAANNHTDLLLSNTETWTFELEGGSTVTKTVILQNVI